MSNSYNVEVVVVNYDLLKSSEIRTVLESFEMEIDGAPDHTEDAMCGIGETTIGFEGEDELVREVSRKIWKANKGYCDVYVDLATSGKASSSHRISRADANYLQPW